MENLNDAIVKHILDMVGKDIDELTYEELDKKYCHGMFERRNEVSNYIQKFGIVNNSLDSTALFKRPSYCNRKKRGTLIQDDKEFCSLGTHLWSAMKKLQYPYYKTLDFPEKSYKHFNLKLGQYWKQLSEHQKVRIVESKQIIENIYN